jgi:bacteriocin-like protein
MKILNNNELTEVTGGDAKETGRAVGNAVQAAGVAAARAAESMISAWLPIARRINSIIR